MASSTSASSSLALIAGLFFLFGFVTWSNGVLIPFLKLACDLKSDAEALLVTSAFYMSYFFLAIPSSWILRSTGYKSGMALGLAIMSAGSLVFIPAALSRSFALFLTGLFVQGMGLALLQTAANPYVTIIGPAAEAASRMAIMGFCNKVAGALAPLLLGAVVLQGASEIEARLVSSAAAARGAGGGDSASAAERGALLSELARRIILPYLLMAGVLGGAAFAIRSAPLPEIALEEAEPSGASDEESGGAGAGARPPPAAPSAAPPRASVLAHPHLLGGVLCIFLYVGVEVMAGDVIGSYAASVGMSLDESKSLTSATLAAMCAMYVVGVFAIPRVVSAESALALSAAAGVAITSAAAVLGGRAAVAAIALLGAANALMWPAIFPLAVAGLGRWTQLGSALLIMAICGGAVVPQVYASLALLLGARAAFAAVTLPAYIYILWYAIAGHKLGRGEPRDAAL